MATSSKAKATPKKSARSAPARSTRARSTKNQKPVVLIMAGGKGERFWPRSRISHPKQLQKVYSARTLLEETIVRARTITDANRIFIGCNPELQKAILKTHKGIKKTQFVIEPTGRNTAPIIVLAALEFEKRFPGAVHVVLSADHYIAPLESFRTTLEKAIRVAGQGWLVTLGVRPTRPEIGYGYIEAGPALGDELPAVGIRSFVEKPDFERAKTYLSRGNFYWNSGIFIWSGALILREFERHAPDVLEPIRSSFEKPARLSEVFPKVPDRPVDVAIMEKSKQIAMVPAEFAWDDVGSWLSLRRIAPGDEAGNQVVSRGPQGLIAAQNSKNNLLVTDKKLVALMGVENLVLVEEEDLLFLAREDQIDRIKDFIGSFKTNPALQKFLH